ncbi:MAG: Xaa-Pro peptidase family protein [Metallosphaera yellowstonensis]|jgi:Xaa-Pro aminopeptidase
MNYEVRMKRLKEMMSQRRIDAVILGPTSNMFYLTGFREEQMERPLLLVVGEEDFVLAPKIYEEQLSTVGLEIRSYRDGEDPYSLIRLKKGSSIAIDDQLWSLFLVEILNRFLPSNISPASVIMKELREVKDEEEIRALRSGLSIAEKSFLEFTDKVKEGENECRLARELEWLFIENGAEGTSFSPILTSGPNTSMPHLRCTSRKVKRGDVIIADFGIKFKGYSTDTTRVLTLGPPSEDVKRIWSIVVEAIAEAESSTLGSTGKDIDWRARKVISSKGFGENFIHRTGHGIGIDVHEDPYIAPDNLVEVKRGSTFTIEPGIYLPGKFGIRVEEMAVMRDKVEILTQLSREIFTV